MNNRGSFMVIPFIRRWNKKHMYDKGKDSADPPLPPLHLERWWCITCSGLIAFFVESKRCGGNTWKRSIFLNISTKPFIEIFHENLEIFLSSAFYNAPMHPWILRLLFIMGSRFQNHFSQISLGLCTVGANYTNFHFLCVFQKFMSIIIGFVIIRLYNENTTLQW